jgi:DNA-binding LacI/PurR family transcriptional regulator
MRRTRKKYEKVQEMILKDFGHLSSGAMLPPEVALVEKYGVSRVTVVRALNELVREGVLERHQGRGTFITEKKLRPQTRSIGVLSRWIPEPGYFHSFYGPMREGVYEVAFENDYTVTLIGARNRKTGAILEPAQAAGKPIDGLIILGIMNADYCARLHETGIPLVGLEYHFEHVAPVDYVVQNCDESAKEISEILIQEGHTRIAFFGQASENINAYDTPDQNVFERLMGIRWGFQAAGAPPSEDLFFQEPHRFGTTRKALEAVYASDSPPTAVFCPAPSTSRNCSSSSARRSGPGASIRSSWPSAR